MGMFIGSGYMTLPMYLRRILLPHTGTKVTIAAQLAVVNTTGVVVLIKARRGTGEMDALLLALTRLYDCLQQAIRRIPLSSRRAVRKNPSQVVFRDKCCPTFVLWEPIGPSRVSRAQNWQC